MDRPPFSFYDAHRQKIEERAALNSPKPMAEPFYGAMTVGFLAGLVGLMALWFGGDPSLSDHRREGVATIVSLIAGGIAYLFFRAQERAFYAAIERETRELWMLHEVRTQRGDAV